MDIDFSHHRMNDFSWIDTYKAKLGAKDFNKFLNIIYGWLKNLRPGEIFCIATSKNITNNNRDLFINGKSHPNYPLFSHLK